MSSNASTPKPADNDPVLPPPVNRHAPTPVELQRQQLAKLLKDPTKEVHIPAPPKEKSLRPPREMMKNVQGSSAGAGSGEFHVYKQNRRREYERLKMMDETTKKEAEAAEFEQRRREREAAADAKTAKNRAKRQKKKNRAMVKGAGKDESTARDAGAGSSKANGNVPIKKRRLADGKEMVFRRPGDHSESDEDEDDDRGNEDVGPQAEEATHYASVVEEPKILIHDDD
ncbi:hypothetical protein FRC03_010460 [Tulasnella sp. 419]|nr:hypothetical protein FRC03_010460 [Tulasnella sp. 419]